MCFSLELYIDICTGNLLHQLNTVPLKSVLSVLHTLLDMRKLSGYVLNITHIPTEGEFSNQAAMICPNQAPIDFEIDRVKFNS